MKSCYLIRLGFMGAVADVSEFIGDDGIEPDVWIINRINVPAKHRGLGYGQELLRQILEDADFEGVTLRLEINPYGDLNYHQLREWYERHGFIEMEDGWFERQPEIS